MTKRINMQPNASVSGGVAIGIMTAAGNPWTVSDAMAADFVNRGLAVYADPQATGTGLSPLLGQVTGYAGSRAIVLFGQSNWRGSARNWGGAGALATTALFKNGAGIADPVSPAVTPLGSVIPYLDVVLRDRGWNIAWRNCGIGSMSLIKQACGQVFNWVANATYFGQRASIGTGDAGDYGDIMVNGTRVFRCTTGAKRYATNASGVSIPNGGGATNVDYIVTPAADDKKTGATQPVSDVGGRALSAAIVGDTFTEPSGLQWTCLATVLGTLSSFKVLASGETGYDPLGLIARVKATAAAVTGVDEVWVLYSSGESDAQASLGSQATIKGWWQQGVTNMVSDLLAAGIKVAIGKAGFVRNSAVFADGSDQYQTLNSGTDAALAALASNNVIAGGDEYTLFGRFPDCYPEPPATAIVGTNAPHRAASTYPATAQEWLNKLVASGRW